jgi:hypothetical protein
MTDVEIKLKDNRDKNAEINFQRNLWDRKLLRNNDEHIVIQDISSFFFDIFSTVLHSKILGGRLAIIFFNLIPTFYKNNMNLGTGNI